MREFHKKIAGSIYSAIVTMNIKVKRKWESTKVAGSIYSATITTNVFFQKKQKELVKSLTISFNKPYTERIAVIIDVTQKQRIQNSCQKKDR